MKFDLGNYKQEIHNDGKDYKDADGLLRCGICHKRKEFRNNLHGKQFVTGCACDCVEKQNNTKRAAERLVDLQKRAYDNVEFSRMTFVKSNCPMEEAEKFVKHFGQVKPWLYIYGGVGSGKTYMSLCIINALMEKGYRCKFINLSKISREYYVSNNKEIYLNNLLSYDVLVIDDFGAERITDYKYELMMSIINGYKDNGKTIIVTTNWAHDEILKDDISVKEKRMYDRLLEQCRPIKWERQSQRLEVAKKKAKTIKAIWEE